MPNLRLAAQSPRMVALCLPRPGARHRLSPALPWRLLQDGTEVQRGLAHTVVLPIDGLSPATRYQVEAEGFAPLTLTTPPCAGLVDIRDHGASPEGSAAQNASAIAEAIAATPTGGTLLIPPGRFVSGPIALKSSLVLHLARGATLAAPASRKGWPILPAHDDAGEMLGSWEGLPEPCFAAPLHAINAQDIAITGPGALDGGGDRGDWWTWPKETRNGARRPRGLHLINCTGVTLLGFTIRNAPSWTIHPQRCRDLTAAALHILAPHDSPNTDGLNPDMCCNVTLTGLNFSVGDDCIAIKAGKRGPQGESAHLRPTRHIHISHCRMERGHGGVVIGAEMWGDVSDVTIAHCEMSGTDRGLRLKTRRGRGGRIDRISLRDVSMDGVLTAFTANAHYFCDPDGHAEGVQTRAPAPLTAGTPQIGDITIRDVEIRNLSHAVGAFLGLPEAGFGLISLENIRVLSLDPEARPEPPIMADHLIPLRHAHILAEHAQVTLDGAPIPMGGLSDPLASHTLTEPS